MSQSQTIVSKRFTRAMPTKSGEDRIRTPDENAGKAVVPGESDAESGAPKNGVAFFDPGLNAIISAWPRLPEALKTGILAMIRATDG